MRNIEEKKRERTNGKNKSRNSLCRLCDHQAGTLVVALLVEAQRGPAVPGRHVSDRERAAGQKGPRNNGLGEARRERARVEEGEIFFFFLFFGCLVALVAAAAASEDRIPEGGPGGHPEEVDRSRRRSGGGVGVSSPLRCEDKKRSANEKVRSSLGRPRR